MNDSNKNKPYVDEKKVWRPVVTSQCFPPDETDEDREKYPPGIYFIAIEELQGAYIDGVWEEAGSDDDKDEYQKRVIVIDGVAENVLVKIEKPRARRYVLKRFTDSGFAENAFTSSYNGARRYR